MAVSFRQRLQIVGVLVATFLSLGLIVFVDHHGGVDGTLYKARLLYLERVPPLFWPKEEFSREGWLAAGRDGRYRYAKALMSRRSPLVGASRDEVIALLGGHASEERAGYQLRKVPLQNLWYVLIVDLEHGKVTRVWQTMAWLDP